MRLTAAVFVGTLALVLAVGAPTVLVRTRSTLHAQARGSTARSTGGTAIMRGRVMSDTGALLRRAQVVVTSQNVRVMGATDEQGRYEVAGLPAGAYTIEVTKAGYVTWLYGQRRPFEPGQTVQLFGGEIRDRIDVVLSRGSVITATVTNAYAERLAGIRVSVMQRRLINGLRRLVVFSEPVDTDDLGQARFYGLPPGQYFLAAGAGSARLGISMKELSYGPTYYPGTLELKDAERVDVGVGQEIEVPFRLIAARPAVLSGVVRTSIGTPIVDPAPAGTPQERRYTIVLRQTAAVGLGLYENANVGPAAPRRIRTDRDGAFSVAGVLPGDYAIEVVPTRGAPIDGPAPVSPAGRVLLRSSIEYARVPIAVAGADVLGLDITTHAGAVIRGQIAFDTGRAPWPQAPPLFAPIILATGSDQPLATGGTNLHDDYTFEIVDVIATGLIRMQVPVDGWTTKNVTINGRDVTQTPVPFTDGGIYDGVRVVVTKKRAEINGAVVDGRGRTVTDYVALLFPQKREWWYPRSSVVRTAHPIPGGRFRLIDLPDGDYYLTAISYLEDGAEQDADLLATLVPRAFRVSVKDGDIRTMNLTLQERR